VANGNDQDHDQDDCYGHQYKRCGLGDAAGGRITAQENGTLREILKFLVAQDGRLLAQRSSVEAYSSNGCRCLR